MTVSQGGLNKPFEKEQQYHSDDQRMQAAMLRKLLFLPTSCSSSG